jgi:hypothetical protein
MNNSQSLIWATGAMKWPAPCFFLLHITSGLACSAGQYIARLVRFNFQWMCSRTTGHWDQVSDNRTSGFGGDFSCPVAFDRPQRGSKSFRDMGVGARK